MMVIWCQSIWASLETAVATILSPMVKVGCQQLTDFFTQTALEPNGVLNSSKKQPLFHHYFMVPWFGVCLLTFLFFLLSGKGFCSIMISCWFLSGCGSGSCLFSGKGRPMNYYIITHDLCGSMDCCCLGSMLVYFLCVTF